MANGLVTDPKEEAAMKKCMADIMRSQPHMDEMTCQKMCEKKMQEPANSPDDVNEVPSEPGI
jgi:hypothetical protein